MKNQNGKYDLEERLIDYGVRIIHVTKKLPESKAGQRIANQLLKSGTSPASNYVEALRAKSKNDYIHKIKISFKKLRETKEWLDIIIRSKLLQTALLVPLIKETDELIASISHESL